MLCTPSTSVLRPPASQRGVLRTARGPVLRATAVSTWEDVETATDSVLPESYQIREEGAVPRTVPSPALPDAEQDPGAASTKPLVFYRDKHAWCPFCERVWMAVLEKGIEHDTVLVDLRDKPAWFTDAVPTGLVPAARVNGGDLIWESVDILKAIEDAFPDTPPLYPDAGDAAAVSEADEALEQASDFGTIAYRYALANDADAETLATQRADFEAAVEALEARLQSTPGAFLLGEALSLPDICMVPTMERVRRSLQSRRGYFLGDPDTQPGVWAWFRAIEALPSYQAVTSDADTFKLVGRRVMGAQEAVPELEVSPAEMAARREAAAKINANKDAVVADILDKSGVGSGSECAAAVEAHLLRVCGCLLTGTVGLPAEEAADASVGAAALAFFRNRASSPRDMSAAACAELRAACDAVLKQCY